MIEDDMNSKKNADTCIYRHYGIFSFFYHSSSGGLVKIKLKLTTLSRSNLVPCASGQASSSTTTTTTTKPPPPPSNKQQEQPQSRKAQGQPNSSTQNPQKSNKPASKRYPTPHTTVSTRQTHQFHTPTPKLNTKQPISQPHPSFPCCAWCKQCLHGR